MTGRESLFEALRERLEAQGPPWGNPHLLARQIEDGYVAGYEALAYAERLSGLLTRAADALHDAAWVMGGAETQPPLPAPVTLVLPQTQALEAEIRAVLADG